jgi:branched-chain amino acid aminotransferase
MKVLGVDFGYTQEQLEEITVELLKKNKPKTDVYFRPFAYAGNLELSPNLYQTKFDFALYMIELGEYLPLDHGVKVKVSSYRRISDNAIPSRAKVSGGYINSALAKKEALEDGYEEAILLTESGSVAEGSSMNVFMVRNGVVVTPSKTEDVLEGITRRSVMEMAKDMGYEVEERVIDRTEFYVADEAFFSGTGAQVAWIASVDNRVIGDGKIGKITKQLQDKFFKVVHGNDEQYSSWCTKVNVKD